MAKQLNEFLSDNSERVIELEARLLEQQRVLDNYKKNHGQLEIFFNAILASVTAIKPLPIKYKPNPQKGDTPVEAVMQISDSHMGSVQESDEIEGFNQYNAEICRARQLDYAERFCKYVDRQRLSSTIDKVHVLVTGDLISGDIHQELQVTNEFPVTVQVVKAAQVLAEQLTIV